MKIAADTLDRTKIKPEDKSFACEFPWGMIGFPDSKKYSIVSTPQIEPFLKMVSEDEPGVHFILVDPWQVKPDYLFEIPDHEVDRLQLEDASSMMTLSVVTIHRKKSGISLNLAAPVVINLDRMTGAQIILDDNTQPLRYFYDSRQE